jgi:AraC-like DNA-binding protein
MDSNIQMSTDSLSYQVALPGKRLSDYVASFWKLENKGSHSYRVEILPDGYFDIVYTSMKRRPFRISLIGLATKPRKYTIPTQASAYGISFKLPAAEYVLKSPIADLLNGYKYLDNTFWCSRNLDFQDLERFTMIFEPIIAACIDKELPVEQVQLFDRIYQSGGLLPVGELSGATTWNSRQINRYFQKYFGLTLKMYCDILRFRSSLNMLNSKELSTMDGYYDQSHYIRQVRKFSDSSPKHLISDPDKAFIQLTS